MKLKIKKTLFFSSLFLFLISGCALFIDIKDPPDTLCGNGTIDIGEECDVTNLAGRTCENMGYASGELSCNSDCIIDTTACVPTENCGNGVLDTDEECDGTELGTETCVTKGFTSGNLSCTGGCKYDTTDCSFEETCGNGVLDGGEECDGTELGTETCITKGFSSGELLCTANCTFDLSSCIIDPDCGNSVIDGDEECDGLNLNDTSCSDFGYESGDLSCNTNCTINSDNCVATCGNAILETGEVCDDGYNDECGSCNADCSGAGSGPGTCGDGVFCPEAGEVCDDGYNDGCGSCNATCDATGTGSICGDGVICPETEVCDDGDPFECGACNAACTGSGSGICGGGYCGNGYHYIPGNTTVSFNTNLGFNNYDYFTPSGQAIAYQAHGKDAVMGIYLNSGDYLLAKIRNNNFDAVLYLLPDCSSTANDDGITFSDYSPSTHGEQLHFQATADGTYYLVVDGKTSTDNGPFSLDIYTGTPFTLASSSPISFNEVYGYPPNNAPGTYPMQDWVEIYNGANHAFNLKGATLVSNHMGPHSISEDAIILGHSYAVIAGSRYYNENYNFDFVLYGVHFDNWISTQNDMLRLETATGSLIDQISWGLTLSFGIDDYLVLEPAFQGDKTANDDMDNWVIRSVGSPNELNP